MLRPVPLLLALMLALSACGSDGRLKALNKGEPLPPGVEASGEAVDGLIVGHRLMEAGEYELALKAYYRAAAEHGLTADVLTAIGSANLKLGRLGQAETMLRRATEEDEEFAAAWNNLGVVLMEQGEVGEAARTFRIAFALDSGESVEIKENLQLALAKIENPAYTSEQQYEFELVRGDSGTYRILATP
ncbi:tetratricopeptide repeat protein [Tropicimonas sp. IMCC6043]|uniref:tetratricopeptide repeat protein n=1 Tax=Tropicimonas sp. IMCC6043 TaxID=2510645 RepID=UPI00101C8CCB|nr:tetratricopeptide repeat protein [Tropicimonas sp. IMCC6043]RYH09455.1 tetratricopeptide repeat protein [Tropicimonas sp. IMCC6043]